MKDKIPFHNISALNSMMINIQEDGQQEVWNIIEKINNPLKRCWARKLMAKAIKKIEENKI